MVILGIESSCDDTAVAIYSEDHGLLAHQINRQIDLHNQHGGVVPELASRDHIKNLLPLVDQCLKESQLTLDDVDGIAYTAGPGLMGSLLVGSAFGASLGFALGKPVIEVHHMEGHLLAPMLDTPKPTYPFLALLVSGGHTQLVSVESFGQYELLGETLDDAAGEAFDKTAKMMGLPYPGGPHLAKLAEKGQARFKFPRPMLDRPGLDFSFSGLKTFARNTIHSHELCEQTKADIAKAFEDAVVDTLARKIKRALIQTQHQCLVIAGGVGANKNLRRHLDAMGKQMNIDVFYPKLEYCTDNAAMIAYAGYERFKRGYGQQAGKIQAKARWPMTDLSRLSESTLTTLDKS